MDQAALARIRLALEREVRGQVLLIAGPPSRSIESEIRKWVALGARQIGWLIPNFDPADQRHFVSLPANVTIAPIGHHHFGAGASDSPVDEHLAEVLQVLDPDGCAPIIAGPGTRWRANGDDVPILGGRAVRGSLRSQHLVAAAHREFLPRALGRDRIAGAESRRGAHPFRIQGYVDAGGSSGLVGMVEELRVAPGSREIGVSNGWVPSPAVADQIHRDCAAVGAALHRRIGYGGTFELNGYLRRTVPTYEHVRLDQSPAFDLAQPEEVDLPWVLLHAIASEGFKLEGSLPALVKATSAERLSRPRTQLYRSAWWPFDGKNHASETPFRLTTQGVERCEPHEGDAALLITSTPLVPGFDVSVVVNGRATRRSPDMQALAQELGGLQNALLTPPGQAAFAGGVTGPDSSFSAL